MYAQNRNRIIYVEARRLRIHPTAQRDGVVKAKVKKFERTMDLDALGTFHAVEYSINGESALWVIDGHHRLLALLNVGLGEWVVRVEVHVDVMTEARASDLFLKLNDRAITRPFETFRNEVQAKRPDAIGIESMVREHGLVVSDDTRGGNIVCVKALKDAYERDPSALAYALDLVTRAWGRTASAVEGKIIEGVSRALEVYGDSIDRPALAKKLGKYPGGPAALLGHAKGRASVTGTTLGRSVADVVIELHDRGKQTGLLRPRVT